LRSDLACLPCAVIQGLRAANAGANSQSLLAAAYCAVLEALGGFDLDKSPAANATLAVKAVHTATGNEDPYKEIKREQNRLALELESEMRRMIARSSHRIETALLVSAFGNIIDLGAQESFDLSKELATLFERRFAISEIGEFLGELERARRLLFLADNAGEIVFDRILLETLPADLEKVLAVKSGPIINDATTADAMMVGADRVARVITTGGSDLGVNGDNCSEEFLEALAKTDIVIAKGHANFETLNEEKRGIFFLLKAKCAVVARALGVETGSLVFLRS
jgi:uncharacterized protein with ATP-grasp and redox domains